MKNKLDLHCFVISLEIFFYLENFFYLKVWKFDTLSINRDLKFEFFPRKEKIFPTIRKSIESLHVNFFLDHFLQTSVQCQIAHLWQSLIR